MGQGDSKYSNINYDRRLNGEHIWLINFDVRLDTIESLASSLEKRFTKLNELTHKNFLKFNGFTYMLEYVIYLWLYETVINTVRKERLETEKQRSQVLFLGERDLNRMSRREIEAL